MSTLTTESYEDYENALGDKIYGDIKENREDHERWISYIKSLVAKGCELEVEEFTNQFGVHRNFRIKITECMKAAISEAQAREYYNWS